VPSDGELKLKAVILEFPVRKNSRAFADVPSCGREFCRGRVAYSERRRSTVSSEYQLISVILLTLLGFS
jgi:hypothetical protein